MRSILLFAFLPVSLLAAPALGVVKPAIAQSDGGDALPAAFRHVAGETLFFSCNIAGFTKSPQEQVNLTYSVQAFDPKGDRKSTRLNSSHLVISYAVFCLKKK